MRPAARSFAVAAATGAFLAAGGCVRWVHLSPADLQAHGKTGLLCSAAATPLAWAANTALYPVGVASLGARTPSRDNLGYPGLAIENGAYFTCAALGLPIAALGWGARQAYFRLAGRGSLEDHLIERLPNLSRKEYALLVRTAGRAYPPTYDDAGASPALPPGARPARAFGLWSTRESPRFGSKPRLGNLLAAAEWRDWRSAGRPRDDGAERAFVVERALKFAEPARQFAATYGAAQAALFEREGGPRRAEAAARTWAAELDTAALARALIDPEPLLRQRAAYALGALGTEAAATALLRSLDGLSHRVRYEALSALARHPAGRPALAAALARRDRHTRIAAAAAIGESAAGPADPLLLLALADPDPLVSAAAAHARNPREDGEPAR